MIPNTLKKETFVVLWFLAEFAKVNLEKVRKVVNCKSLFPQKVEIYQPKNFFITLLATHIFFLSISIITEEYGSLSRFSYFFIPVKCFDFF